MDVIALNRFLTLYTWFPLAALLFFLLLIARFYQKFSNEHTHFRFFLLPMILFGASTVRYGSIPALAGDALGDLLAAAGGVTLLLLCVNLYRCMLHRREG